MSKIVAITNQKGGVGKTTTAINLAAGLAHLGQETLLIDLDPQGNSTSGLGIDKTIIQKQIYHVLIDELPLEEILKPTEDDWLDLAPSTMDLIGAEVELVPVIGREFRLKKALERFEKVYKYIIIDCPPSLGLLTLNALVAANSVAIPLQAEYYSLEGLGQLLKTVELIRKSVNPNLDVEGVLITMYDKRMNLSKQVIEEIEKYFGDKVFKTRIPRTVRIAEAPGFGKAILSYDRTSRGAKAYLAFAQEFLDRQVIHAPFVTPVAPVPVPVPQPLPATPPVEGVEGGC